ncbi:MAG: sulfurtransferase [Hyphomicrobiaceae bacterium]
MTEGFRRPQHLVSVDWLAANQGRPDLRVFDCTVHLHPLPDLSGQRAESGRADYDAGHIPGSGFIDLQADLSDGTSPLRFVVPSADHFAAAMSRLGIGEGTRVVLYDRTRNQWAARVWWMMRGFGFDDVAVLDGGVASWTHAGHPLTREPTIYPAARFLARPRPGYFVGKEEVRAAIGRPGTLLLNALTEEQHAGSAGVTYGRAGRIPGSAVVSARALIDPQTQAYKSPAELRALFEAAGATTAERVIVYCGGGIAASSDALVLSLLGVDNVGIYTNSLQEWANDPSCPMERG